MEDSKFDLPKPHFKLENEYCNYNQGKTNLFRIKSLKMNILFFLSLNKHSPQPPFL